MHAAPIHRRIQQRRLSYHEFLYGCISDGTAVQRGAVTADTLVNCSSFKLTRCELHDIKVLLPTVTSHPLALNTFKET